MSRTRRCHLKSLGDSCFLSPIPGSRMLCGSWIRLSRWQRKRSRLLPRPSNRLTQLGSLVRVRTNVFSRLPPLAQEGRMETSPVPSPIAVMEPRGWHLCWVRAGVRRTRQSCNSAACPQLAACLCQGQQHPRLSRWSSWSQGEGETGWLRTGRLLAVWPAGEEPGTGERGHWQCKPAPDGDLSVCLSVLS